MKQQRIRQIIYFHQSLPLFPFRPSFFERGIIEYLFYYFVYPLYVRLFLNECTFVAVQTEDIKLRFADRFQFPLEKISVYFPDFDVINSEGIIPYDYENELYNFIYPSMGAPYKEHMTIVKALEKIYNKNPKLAQRIKIHFTLREIDNKNLFKAICRLHQHNNFVFHGNICHNQVMSMIKSCDGLLFPSVIETLGLPLLEAASLGKSVVANDMGYVHEVLKDYKGVNYVAIHDYNEWANQMMRCCERKEIFSPYHVSGNDSWKYLIRQIRGEVEPAKEKRIICVLATASATRGALMIYNQFIRSLEQDTGFDEWHVFVDVGMPMPKIPHVKYHVFHTKGLGRFWFDLVGFNREIKRLGITPDTIFSLQNTGVRC